MTDSKDLSEVYSSDSPDAARALYNDWSRSYDVENLRKGFWLPMIGAGLFAKYMGRSNGPFLDAGCGTGLVGHTLNVMGYGGITGCDLSPEMIAHAEKTGAYDGFAEANMGAGLPFADGAFAGFTCIGSFGPGHAPPESLRHLMRVTRKGGIGVFNLVSKTQAEQGFPPVMQGLSEEGTWALREQTPEFRAFLLDEPELTVRCYVVERL